MPEVFDYNKVFLELSSLIQINSIKIHNNYLCTLAKICAPLFTPS